MLVFAVVTLCCLGAIWALAILSIMSLCLREWWTWRQYRIRVAPPGVLIENCRFEPSGEDGSIDLTG